MDTPTSTDPFAAPSETDLRAPGFRSRTTSKAPAVRAGMALGVALLVVIGSAVALGASPSTTSSGGGAGQAAASGSPAPEKGPRDGHGFGPGGFGPGGFGPGGFGGLLPGLLDPGRGGRGFGQITITAISGADVSLETEDGWTRTITITPDTTITRGGAAATAADLKVGATIRFRQTKNADGTFTIQAIDIVLPQTVGTIAEVGSSSITITDRDGATVTVRLGAGTTFRVRGVDNATAASLAKGMVVLVVGERRADGSIDATTVVAGQLRDHVKIPWPGRPGSSGKPEASNAAG
jgi:uncharacterized protein DUF5666